MRGELAVKVESNVTHTSVIPRPARKDVQWPAVRKTVRAINVPLHSTSFPPDARNSAISAPTSGCVLPSRVPFTIALARPDVTRTSASVKAIARAFFFISVTPPFAVPGDHGRRRRGRVRRSGTRGLGALYR